MQTIGLSRYVSRVSLCLCCDLAYSVLVSYVGSTLEINLQKSLEIILEISLQINLQISLQVYA
jgi:hypothetical protein